MKPQDIHIGFSCVGQRFSYWAVHIQAAKERAAELGVNLSISPAATLADQVAAVKGFVAQGVDALIVGPVDGSAPDLRAAAEEAVAARIPVVATSTNIEGCQVTWVGADTFKGGKRAAMYLAERLGSQGKVAIIAPPLSLPRIQGFHKGIDAQAGWSIVFEKKGDWTRESGVRLMHEALSAHPDLTAVYAANDPMALGAVEAIAQAGRTGEVAVLGCDGLAEALAAIGRGTMVATVNQVPSEVGRLTVETALRILRGEVVPPLLLLEAPLITVDNLMEASMDVLDLLPRVLNDLVESNNEQQRLHEEYAARLEGEAAERDRLQQEVIEAQRRALAELSTPIIPVLEGVIVMPLIGSVDTLRARDITRALLAGIREHRAKVVILDITGVPLVDSGVAAYLNRTIQAARLKGARTIVTGISEAVAETIVDLGIDWSGIETLSDLQTGLRAVLAEMGRHKPHK